MILHYPAASRFSTDLGWLVSHFSFSFGEYYDPENSRFGPMRVLNDDYVQGGRGFGAHPHREMEIVSIVLEGQLEHQDSTGHRAITTFGGVQRMTAGTGIIHSEVNPGKEEVCLLQMWFDPEERGLAPSYETTEFNPAEMKNHLLPVVSKAQTGPNIASIHQDLTLYLSDLDPGRKLSFEQSEGRRIFFMVLEGKVTLNGVNELNRRDSARITDTASLIIESSAGARIMLIDLP
ncbi:pirin family protein [Paenibacillus sp. FJAT-26967]|uniref:pirin family protein n=1 Tax=Paenibacillus sp. FJAT-26967 TaxID=1729690 RepID=UPI00083854CF|nr:pirin family protein [Paenibacillus sp. FJAT-26967]